jgi:hypothetical protein
MRNSSVLLVALLFGAVVLGSDRLEAQQNPGAATARATAENVQAWFGELGEIHEQLEEIQVKALQDPELSAAQAELGEQIKQAMEQADPMLAEKLARMETMEQEAAAAQQTGNTAKLMELGAEAEGIQRQFLAAQEKALEQPAIAARVTAFQQHLERKMSEVNPDTQKLIARFRELEARLIAESGQVGAAR